MSLMVDIKKKCTGFHLQVQFELHAQTLGLLGASGAGKSMTLRCIAGIEKPDSGLIIHNNKVLYDSNKGVCLSAQERKIGYLFQHYALFPHMTVEENIGFALQRLQTSRKRAVVKEKMAMMHLEGLEERLPSQLSGGQQQRVALARALAVEPELLLLDEPFSALDQQLRFQMVRQLMEGLQLYQGSTVFVGHDMEEVFALSQALMILDHGKVEASGNKERLFQTPPSRAAAQLLGCQNFSAVIKQGTQIHTTVDWGVTYDSIEESSQELIYAGIRQQDMRLAEPSETAPTVDCRPVFVHEGPLTVIVELQILKTGQLMQWEIHREQWLRLKHAEVIKIALPTDRIMWFSR